MPGFHIYVFVDAAQLREGLTEIGADWSEVDLAQVARVVVQNTTKLNLNPNPSQVRVLVYDAVRHDEAAKEAELPQQIEDWLRRTQRLRDVHVRYGAVWREPSGGKRDQKRVDVQLTVDALVGAIEGAYETAILVSGDDDFVPLAEEITRHGRRLYVAAFERRLSTRLAEQADGVWTLPEAPAVWASWKLGS